MDSIDLRSAINMEISSDSDRSLGSSSDVSLAPSTSSFSLLIMSFSDIQQTFFQDLDYHYNNGMLLRELSNRRFKKSYQKIKRFQYDNIEDNFITNYGLDFLLIITYLSQDYSELLNRYKLTTKRISPDGIRATADLLHNIYKFSKKYNHILLMIYTTLWEKINNNIKNIYFEILLSTGTVLPSNHENLINLTQQIYLNLIKNLKLLLLEYRAKIKTLKVSKNNGSWLGRRMSSGNINIII